MIRVCSMASAEAIKDVAGGSGGCGGTSVHNDLTGLNDGDYQHLTVSEKILAIGVKALGSTFTGLYALEAYTSGLGNTAFGESALTVNTSGSSNTAIGYEALVANIVGIANVAIGYEALFSNLGNNNTSVGNRSLRSITTGDENTAIGNEAGQGSDTGFSNSVTDEQMTFVGANASRDAVTANSTPFTN